MGLPIEYLRDQLEHLSQFKSDSVQLSITDGVYERNDVIMDEELRNGFLQHCEELEMSLEKKKDWHPGSDGFVWDLVHPSLYCLAYGITRRTYGDLKPWRNWLGSGHVISCAEEATYGCNSMDDFVGNYQWIPSEVFIHRNGTASIDSYINNLHPATHKELYKDIEKILTHFVPMFERVLADSLNPAQNAAHSILHDQSAIELVRLDEFCPSSTKPVDLKNRQLQIMVKLASFELTPERPSYFGGSWHVEALKNESIVAVGIYYYKNENITDSKLRMRWALNSSGLQIKDPAHYDIDGYDSEHQQTQELGAVKIREGLCLAFPNTYQHRVSPFELVDKTRSGHRKILVFFLVDPAKPILSTKDIPPQQRDWMLQELREGDFPNLPGLVVEKILDHVGWPMSLSEAKKHRQSMVEERTDWARTQKERNFLLMQRMKLIGVREVNLDHRRARYLD